MIDFQKQAAQGDMLITQIDDLPDEIVKMEHEDGVFVCTHSETGHNHVVQSQGVEAYKSSNDEFIMYLVVNEPTELKHLRGFDTHKPITISPGKYIINRQREYTPKGFRMVQD